MMLKNAYAVIILLAVLVTCVQCAYAAPTTGAATDATSKNLTFHATGAVGNTWWEYGQDYLIWKTQNATPVAGVAALTQSGLPLMAGQTYSYKACDSTGCGLTLSTALLSVTPNPTSTYGRTLDNITSRNLDIGVVAGSLPEAYTQTPGGGIKSELVFGVLLFFVFTGLWMRQRETIIPLLLGLIGSGMLIYTGANGSSVGVPVEFVIFAMLLVSLGLTGILTGMFKR